MLKSFQASLAKLYFPFLHQRFSGLIDNILGIDLSLVKASCRWAAERRAPRQAGAAASPRTLGSVSRPNRSHFAVPLGQDQPTCHPLPPSCQLLTPALTVRSSDSSLEKHRFSHQFCVDILHHLDPIISLPLPYLPF